MRSDTRRMRLKRWGSFPQPCSAKTGGLHGVRVRSRDYTFSPFDTINNKMRNDLVTGIEVEERWMKYLIN